MLEYRIMKKTCIQRFSSTLALVAPSVVMVASQADGDAYIKFDGVDGEKGFFRVVPADP